MNGLFALSISISSMLLMFALVKWVLTKERRRNKFSPFTEKSLRSPGYTLGKELDEAVSNQMDPVLYLVFAPPIFVLSLMPFNSAKAIILFIALAILFLYQGKQFVVRSADVRNKRLGLDGEVYTGQELNYLMRLGAYVFHDIPYKYGNIDHIIVAPGGVFVVETKAVRKPASLDGKRQSKVTVKDGKLHFPGFANQAPLQQAMCHAEFMRSFLKKKTASDVPVIPVVALPGWFVEVRGSSDCLVINPKRGKALHSYIQRTALSEEKVYLISNLVEDFARSVLSSIDRFDPDAAKKFDFWLDRKAEERKIE